MMDDLLQEMIDPAPAPHDAPRRWRLWTTVAIVGLAAVGATTLTTSAIFTDDDSTSAAIHTGSIDLVLGSAPFTFTPQDLAPGSSTFVPMTVSNAGSLQLRYAISYYAEATPGPGGGNLSNVLELRMYATADCSADGTNALQTINVPAVPAVNWPTAALPLVGNPTQGADPGDRTLAGGSNASEPLCARVDFPQSAGNEYQDSTVTLHFAFNAEQTLNN